MIASSAFVFSIISTVMAADEEHAADCSKAEGQMQLNQCYGDVDLKTEKKLEETYKKLVEFIKTNKHSKDVLKLEESQKSWLLYRKNDCEDESSRYEGGSMQPMVLSGCMMAEATERINQLNKMINEVAAYSNELGIKFKFIKPTCWEEESDMDNNLGDICFNSNKVRWDDLTSNIKVISNNKGIKIVKLLDKPLVKDITYNYLGLKNKGNKLEVYFYKNKEDLQRHSSYIKAIYVKPGTKQNVVNSQETSNVVNNNVQGVIYENAFQVIRQRVEKANKIISKRISGKKALKPPSSLKEEAEVMQFALNSKEIIPDKGFVAECFYNGASGNGREYIYCNMFFPGKFQVGGVPMRFVHYIESVSSNIAYSFKQRQLSSFDVSALVNVEGGFVPVCRFIYDKEFDLITPIYNVK
jgi:uncharacterized protein YecT (DUF1311 family)